MSLLSEAGPCLFFASFLYRKDIFDKDHCEDIFTQKQKLLFTYTHDHCPMINYYEKEMGTPLARLWFFGAREQKRESLVSLKQWSTVIENDHAIDGKRSVNIDMGYLTTDQVVLATGKPYSHRLYLGEGVYGELTYIFKDRLYHTLPWTYPDYAHKDVSKVFVQARNYLMELARG